MTTQVTTVQPMTGQLSTVIKPQVSIILGYAIERELAKSHGGWKSNTLAEVILPVVLYGCETWTLSLREEQRLRVFENKVLRKIFGAKRDEVTGEWGKLHNTELHALYSSPDLVRNIKSRRLRWAGHVARMGESRNAKATYLVLVGRPEGKRPLWRPRHRWEDNIKIDLREGLLLRNSRHHLIRSKIAAALRNKGWIVEDEISYLAENGSTRRVDILAYNADTKQGIIVDPTIRFEVECLQSAEVHLEKKSIYEPMP
ncbi:hypothetical protein ANN_10453 [Periplaneta americana]|uniref:Uncharacterized protein n=1 Tax=Periplaneta americana TaxID=6978 RepID=A0ABQ8TPB5_PERAM|nr:hypothetical protein ANN_10453 [Periplaneta americana]